MTHDEALTAAAQLLHAAEYAPVGDHAHINACANMAATYVAYARELRESGAMRPAEQPKPSAGPWFVNGNGNPQRNDSDDVPAAIVSPSGWYVWPPDGDSVWGVETGDEGKSAADAVARTFYTLED